MQTVTCSVALAGDLNNVRVFGPTVKITVPEVLVLRHIHGFDAVTDIVPSGSVKRTAAEEVRRLKAKYDWNRNGEGSKPVIPDLFPGARPNLPMTLEDIMAADPGAEVEDVPEGPSEDTAPPTAAEEEPVPPRRAKSARAEALD